MKLTKQSFEILEQKDFSLIGIKKFIERCGRVCYKSEDRITDDSYEKFVNMLEKRDHARPLEFGTVHLKMHILYFLELKDVLCVNKMWNNGWIKYHYIGKLAYVTTNYRYYLSIIKVYPGIQKSFDTQDDKLYPRRYTVHFITSRGIMDEFRTHVGLSHLAESTRYCNYNKDKFNNQVTFIIPNWVRLKYDYVVTDDVGNNEIYVDGVEQDWYDEDDEITKGFLYGVQDAEGTYIKLLKKGCTPQQAREVLPLSVKSELISCGFGDAWSNFFYRRCANDAHPMAREIAIPLQEKFKELNYINQ